MRDTLSSMMTAQVPTNDEIAAVLENSGFAPTVENAIAFSALLKAAHGDIEAARYVRDTLGEKPTENFNMSAVMKPLESLDLTQYTDAELEQLAYRYGLEPIGDLSKLSDEELEALADEDFDDEQSDDLND